MLFFFSKCSSHSLRDTLVWNFESLKSVVKAWLTSFRQKLSFLFKTSVKHFTFNVLQVVLNSPIQNHLFSQFSDIPGFICAACIQAEARTLIFKWDYRLNFDFSTKKNNPFVCIQNWRNRTESPKMVMYFQRLTSVLLHRLKLAGNTNGHFTNASFSNMEYYNYTDASWHIWMYQLWTARRLEVTGAPCTCRAWCVLCMLLYSWELVTEVCFLGFNSVQKKEMQTHTYFISDPLYF